MVSFTWAENVTPTDGGTITVTGINFRTSDFSPSSEFHYNLCSTANWVATTSLVCVHTTTSQVGPMKDVVVTANSIVGTRTGYFTFDGMWMQLSLLPQRAMCFNPSHPLRLPLASARGQLPRCRQQRALPDRDR